MQSNRQKNNLKQLLSKFEVPASKTSKKQQKKPNKTLTTKSEQQKLTSEFSNLSLSSRKIINESSVSESILNKLSQSNSQITRLFSTSEQITREQFYFNQRVNKFDHKRPQRIVLIRVSDKINKDWIDAIKNAITVINSAAPGLSLRLTQTNPYDVEITSNSSNEAWARGDIIQHKSVEISLDNSWSTKKATIVHELLHALGFDHEHQRKDGEKYYNYQLDQMTDYWKSHYSANSKIHGITAFDPYSIMNYYESQKLKRKDTEPVWKLKSSTKKYQQLSELDKVALNLIHPPCYVPNVYEPKKSKITKMYYCGRKVMQNHNMPAESLTDGSCGMDNGPNCHACRTLANEEFDKLMGRKRWQGWSGMVYCGKQFRKQSEGHDGVCGPNNGPPCEDCEQLML